MKQIFFSLLLLSVISFSSCRKDKNEPNIKQYDQAQILSYISANAIPNMVRDTIGGDTTGMYYQILKPGTGPQIQYADKISLVFSLRTFDGKYTSLDTINNHFEDYVGHIKADALPLGLQTAIVNNLKYSGGSMRLLIPSHLAYGISGYGTGSTQNAGTHIGGNQSLDYYVNVVTTSTDPNSIKRQAAYDDMVIQNYMRDSSFTGYTKTASGLYYKVLTAATGTDPITVNSTITSAYIGELLNNSVFDGSHTGANLASFNVSDFATPGNTEGLTNFAKTGTKISLLMPSALGYGLNPPTGSGIPVNSCLKFTWVISAVTL